LGHLQQAPIVEEPVMQPVLADGGELAAEALVEIVDDFWVALHGALQILRPDRPETVFRTLLNQFRGKSNHLPRNGGSGTTKFRRFRGFQQAASANAGAASCAGSSLAAAWLWGQPRPQAL